MRTSLLLRAEIVYVGQLSALKVGVDIVAVFVRRVEWLLVVGFIM